MKMFNISFRRVGGINFLHLGSPQARFGRITIMWCVSKPPHAERRTIELADERMEVSIMHGKLVRADAPAPRDHVTNEHNCAMGLHSWCDEVGVLPPDTPCAHCGETYGFVTKDGNPYSGEIRW